MTRQVVAAFAVLIALGVPSLADAHKGSPNFRSTVRVVSPAEPGIDVQVLNYDDRLQLINRSGRTVLVRGYDGEPYIRLLQNGVVEVNKNSPSYYLNQDRYANVTVPSSAGKQKPPAWDLVDKTGRYEWHDHRIHYMGKGVPAQVKKRSERTKVFNWQVPIEVGNERARLRGDLYWDPPSGGLPRGAMLGMALVVFGSVCFVEIVRRRRRRHDGRRSRTASAWG
jgi:hypothetical protein